MRLGGQDTIFALASGVGRAAVAVLRLSGGGCGGVIEAMTGRPVPPPRRASLRTLRDAGGLVLDQALVLWLPGPASFTGEDQAELHLHGGAAVRAAVLRALAAEPGCRPAEPGEFTRRAFLNGKLDLAAVEGLADLIDAETEAQRRQAVRQLGGGLSDRIAAWRDCLADVLARIEAGLDFADEDDTPQGPEPADLAAVAALRREMEQVLAEGDRGERLREGYTVVIAGRPNAGKSTLLNAIARRDVAIVSDVPGTTRDAIEIGCDLDGLPVTFVDTAGLRPSSDAIEQEGVRRAEGRMRSADLVLWLDAADDPAPGSADLDGLAGPALVVGTKHDLGVGTRPVDLRVSARTGAGLADLMARIGAMLAAGLPSGDGALLTRARHRLALGDAVASLVRAEGAGHKAGAELVAEDLRLALRALGRIVGDVDVEHILDRIFAQFCIGK